MTFESNLGSWAKLRVVRIVAAVAVFEVMTITAFLAVNTRLKHNPAEHLRKRHPFIDNINNDGIEDHAMSFLSETRDLYNAEGDDHGPNSADMSVVGAVAAAAHATRISDVKLDHTDHDNIESHSKGTDNDSNGGGGDNNNGSDSGIADELDTVSEVRANAKLERLYQIRKRHHVIDTDDNNNDENDSDGNPRNHTMVKDNGKGSGGSDSHHHRDDGVDPIHSFTGKSARMEYKVLPNHNMCTDRRQISINEMMGNSETAKMIHEFDTDLEMKAFVESENKNKFPYDFVRLLQSGKYRLISGMDAKENARKIIANRRVAGHCILVKSGESVIMAGEVVLDENTGRIIVYGKSGHYRPSSHVGIRQVGRHFHSYFSNEH